MPDNPPPPTVDDIRRIGAIKDPVIRNLHITQCYHDLSSTLARRTGLAANWCTFATWASKQAGQTIRKEDLLRALENRLKQHTPPESESFAVPGESPPEPVLSAPKFALAIDRASDAVGRGNKKVFDEIGYEFARFYQTCLPGDAADDGVIARFIQDLRPGDPPEGQAYLRQAFTRYYRALFLEDPKTRAELILLANLEIGFHEQTRLQPEIAESLDAGFFDSIRFVRLLLAGMFPASSLPALTNLYFRRLLGRPTALDLAVRRLQAGAHTLFRQEITEKLMTMALPSGMVLRLSRDLGIEYPESLKTIQSVELQHFLNDHDPSLNSTVSSGAVDWANLPERLHYIIDLFRCCQDTRDLLAAPFLPDQVDAFHAGRLPAGRL